MSPSATMVSRSAEEPASSLTRISKGFEGIAAKFLWTEYWKLVCRTKTRGTIRGTVITGTVTPYGGATRRRRFPRLTADSGEIASRRLEIRSNDTSVPLEPKRFTKGFAPNNCNTRRAPLIVHTATDTASKKLRSQNREVVAPLCSLILFHHVQTTAGLTPHGLSFGRRGLDLIRLSFRYRRGKDTEMSVFTTGRSRYASHTILSMYWTSGTSSLCFLNHKHLSSHHHRNYWVHVKRKADLSVPEIKILHDD